MPTTRPALALLLALSLVGLAAAADPDDKEDKAEKVVTLQDGFTIRGRVARETELIEDMSTGKTIKVARLGALDIIQSGPRFVIVSTKTPVGARIDAAPTPVRTTYKTELGLRLNKPINPIRETRKVGLFNDKWVRTLETIDDMGQPQTITQQVLSLDPEMMLLGSRTDQITQASYTTEETPALVRDLLARHPDLREPPNGPPDPAKRIKIASFLREVADADGTRRALVWADAAKTELARLRSQVPEATWPKPVADQAAAVAADIARSEAGVWVEEIEAAARTGRYDAARAALAAFNPEKLDEARLTRLAVARAAVEAVRPGYEQTAKRLRAVVERESGMAAVVHHSALAGVSGGLFAPRPALSAESQALIGAADQVLAELSPDTAPQLELFKDAAGQAETARAAGREPMDKPAALLAYAVSGWVRGKNGADADIPGALRAWEIRRLALDYLREPLMNTRAARFDEFAKRFGAPPGHDELAQVLTLLPQVAPVDLANPDWTPVPKDKADGVGNVVRMNTGPTRANPRGVDYVLRLPPEYHHGRVYPVLIAIPGRAVPAERMVAHLAEQAERNGYILACPDWSVLFAAGTYDYTGKDHPIVTDTLRDILRRFQADPDRVFLFGYEIGADFALDLGMAHPDLFAGVSGFGPYPNKRLAVTYWSNVQRLPVYLVTGELTGTFDALRVWYGNWMQKGFPAVLTVYRGRGLQWYGAELPRLFDWMARKKRVRGAATLRRKDLPIEPWQVLRESDNRFYWVGVADGGLTIGNPLADGVPPRLPSPAQFSADINAAGAVVISNNLRIRKFTIWLERDLIDWNRKLVVTIGGNRPLGYVPQKVTPDVRFMLEELHRTGDRKLLFLGKIEVRTAG